MEQLLYICIYITLNQRWLYIYIFFFWHTMFKCKFKKNIHWIMITRTHADFIIIQETFNNIVSKTWPQGRTEDIFVVFFPWLTHNGCEWCKYYALNAFRVCVRSQSSGRVNTMAVQHNESDTYIVSSNERNNIFLAKFVKYFFGGKEFWVILVLLEGFFLAHEHLMAF